MRAIRLVVAAAGLAAAIHVAPVAASAYSLDQSDLWWIPAESGWGIQLVQRSSLIFATMFVYAANGTPTWYVALLKPPGAGSDDAAKALGLSWSGDLYATTGTGFGAMWNPNAFSATKVGTMMWTPTDAISGMLVYSVNGIPVTKSIVREFIAFDDFSGTFQGGIQLTQAGCTDPSKNGTFDDFANVTITQSSSQSLGLALTTATTGVNCTFQGPLTQAGRFGAASGTFVCNGKTTTGSLFNMVVGPDSIVVHFKSSDSANGCTSTGAVAGVRM
ncbi:MAG TPA: hypothetical protein VLG08_06010 [Casimicrobiaceae bacterium]|jgi:hypothetical protein|nr:hypothetical protein [Casimicrobiaceae bacterium]